MRPHAATLALLLAACGAPARAPVVAPAVQSPPARVPDTLDARSEALVQRLREAGGSGPVDRARGFLAERERATHDVTVPAGQCATLTVLASPGLRDIDAALFTREGDPLATDTAQDPHPTVQVCAARAAPRRAALVLVAYAGAGAYTLSSFTSPRAALPALALAVGGTPGRAPDPDDTHGGDARLRELTSGALRRGFAPRGPVRDVSLVAGQRVWLPVPLEAGACVLVAALSGDASFDVDAALLDADGAELARDVGTGRDARLQLCAAQTADLTLVLTAAHGDGTAQTAVLVGPASRVGGEGALWLGRSATRHAPTNSLVDPDGCDAPTRLSLARAAGDGFAAQATPRCAPLARGEARRVAVHVEGGVCARFEAVASPGIARAHVALTRDGAPFVEHTGRGLADPAIVHVCSAAPLDLEASVVARAGSGAIGLLVATRRRASETALSPDAEASLLDERARVEAGGATLGGTREGRCAPAAPLAIDIAAGTCTRAAFVAAEGAPVELRAIRGGDVVGRDVGPAPHVGHCAPPGAPRRVEVRCTPVEGSGAPGHWALSTRTPGH